jgi:hypothetical protein
MVRLALIFIFIALYLFGSASISRADLVINEVMANEPNSSVNKEWIEIYNTDPEGTTTPSSFFRIYADGTVLTFLTEIITSDPYVVICRNELAFESEWGNSSGVWGDDPSEDYPLIEKTGFSLGNSAGSVLLYYLSTVISRLEWTESGSDGVSWERLGPFSSVINPCIDVSGSTPGRPNSRLPKSRDLALLPIIARPGENGSTDLDIRIVNIGIDPVADDSLFLFFDPERDGMVTRADLIAVFDLPVVTPGETLYVYSNLELDGFYVDILARLFADEDESNNTHLFVAPGRDYPPFILSEFIPDPQSPLETEWVEIRNRSGINLDIRGWYLGDRISLHSITDTQFRINGGEYLVLCKDSLEFVDFYGEPDFPVIALSGWPTLNNDGDLVRLVDNYGLTADSIVYDSSFGDNYGWGRGELPGYTDRWGRTIDIGGTPGSENSIYFPASSGSIIVSVDPDPFSPYWHYNTIIDFTLPPGLFSMKLYDIEGRLVRTFYDNFPAFDGAVSWDGSSDSGDQLPVGIYILFVEVIGREQFKRTVVIAP